MANLAIRDSPPSASASVQESSIAAQAHIDRRKLHQQDQLRIMLAEVGFQSQPDDVRQKILQVMLGT